jgi:hypothetical protein
VPTATTTPAPFVGRTWVRQDPGGADQQLHIPLPATHGRKTLQQRLQCAGQLHLVKSIDDGSANKGNGITHSNPFDNAFEKGPSDFDHTHVFTASGCGTSSSFRQQTRGQRNRRLEPHRHRYSPKGNTFTGRSGVDNSRRVGQDRADIVGNPYFSGDRSRDDIIAQYLNKAAFTPNAPGTFGSQGRNRFRGPGFANFDFGLHKNFRSRNASKRNSDSRRSTPSTSEPEQPHDCAEFRQFHAHHQHPG